ncbi:MAG: T9SS type A sorting domain-containing protein [Chitinophagaceae bacterium]|nr:T9SS type A sorting domain-containing protein [Chitinophagaceae bacterium]
MEKNPARIAYLICLTVFTLFLPEIVSSQSSLRFNGTNNYVQCNNGNAVTIGGNFTIEAWIKIEGRGRVAATGAGTSVTTGFTNIIPLVTKGRAVADGTNSREINYFFGYDSATRQLVAYYEVSGGLNNRAMCTTPLDTCTWTHVAVTCDMTNANSANRAWIFYINGVQQNSVAFTANAVPVSGALAPLTLGSAFDYTGSAVGTSLGNFEGKMDEVRIWSAVRTPAEISANYANELAGPQTNMIARYALNEQSGTTITNNGSVGATGNGTLVNTPGWFPNFGSDGLINPAQASALDFNGSSQYVSMGKATSLNTGSFTIEAWIRIEGTHTATSTGTGGITSAIPIVTKGRGEAETPSNLNMNYFMGIDNTTGQLAADFEEAYNGTTAPNHPIIGNTVLAANTWYHVAVTYGSGTWKLYVNGVLDKSKAEAGSPSPELNSIQHAAIGSALTSDGTAAGFFNGKIDDVRIWNTARSQVDIQTNMYQSLSSGTGLLGSWKLNENVATKVENSVANSCSSLGTLKGGPSFTGANFTPLMADNTPSPSNGATNYNGNTFTITPTHSSGSTMSVTLYTRIINTGNFVAVGTNASAASGTPININWISIQPNTTYEWFVSMTNGSNVVNGKVYTVSTAGFIPVKFVSFEGAVINNQVQLKWSTLNEMDNDYFQIERSTDGRKFSPIGKIKGQLNSTSLSTYNFTDPNPNKGVSYYQLKQVDIDEHFSVSKVVRVTVTDKGSFGLVIFPNPIKGNEINLSFLESINNSITVKIFDLAGKLQLNQQVSVENQNTSIRHTLANGIYILKVSTAQNEYSQKIIVQK